MNREMRLHAIQERLMDAIDLKYKNVLIEMLEAKMKEDDGLMNSLEEALGGFRYTSDWQIGDVVKLRDDIDYHVIIGNPGEVDKDNNLQRRIEFAQISEIHSRPKGKVNIFRGGKALNSIHGLLKESIVTVAYEYYDKYGVLKKSNLHLTREDFFVSKEINELTPLTKNNYPKS